MKQIFLIGLALSISATVFAGSISRGGASFSRTSAPLLARSVGMTRPSVTAPKSAPAPAPPSTAHPAAQAAPTQAPAITPSPAPSGGSTFLSSFGGGLVGSMIGASLVNRPSTTIVNNGGGTSPAQVGGSIGALPAYIAPSPAPSSGDNLVWGLFSGLLGMVFIAALLAVVWFVVNKIKRVRAKANPGGLPFSPVGRFLEVQYAFASKDAGVLRALLGKDLVDQILANLPEGEPRQQTIWAVHYNVVDVSTNAISIIYTAEDSADNTTLQETWHYVPSGAAWVLNGIEVNKQDALYLAKAL